MSHSFTSGGGGWKVCSFQPQRAAFPGKKLRTSSLTDARTVVSRQLEAGLALTREGAWHVDAAVLAVPVPALINVWMRDRGRHILHGMGWVLFVLEQSDTTWFARLFL